MKKAMLAALAAILSGGLQLVAAADDLPEPQSVPALMKTFGGVDVKTRADWENVRAPELLE